MKGFKPCKTEHRTQNIKATISDQSLQITDLAPLFQNNQERFSSHARWIWNLGTWDFAPWPKNIAIHQGQPTESSSEGQPLSR